MTVIKYGSFKDLSAQYLEALQTVDLEKAAKIRGYIPSFEQSYERDALLNLAKNAYDSGHSAEATELCRICVQLHPEWAEAWYSVGYSLLGTKHFEEARNAIETSILLDPEKKGASQYEPNEYGIARMGCFVDERDPASPCPVFSIVSKNETTQVNDTIRFKAGLIVLLNCQPEDYEDCWKLLMWKEGIVDVGNGNDLALLGKVLGDSNFQFHNNLFRAGYVRVFGQLAPTSVFHAIKTSNIEKGLPFIPLNVMMKAGNHYLSGTLQKIYNAPPFVWTQPTGVLKDVLAYLSTGGLIGRNMEPASAEIVDAYLANGINEIVVQIRDPRQAAYSLGVFKDNEFTIENDENCRNLDENEKIDFWIDSELPELVHFIESWINVENSGKLKVHFSRFDDFIKDPCDVINCLLSLYKAPCRLSEALITPQESGAYRAGELNEWKRTFSEAQTRKANKLVSNSILHKFDWH